MRVSTLRIAVWIGFFLGVLAPMLLDRSGAIMGALHMLWPGRTLLRLLGEHPRDPRATYVVNFLIITAVAYLLCWSIRRTRSTAVVQ